MLHHTLAKQIKGSCQCDKKQTPSNFEQGRFSSRSRSFIRIHSHLRNLLAKSSDCHDSKGTIAFGKANNLYYFAQDVIDHLKTQFSEQAPGRE
jgi:hypothetical protein